MKKPYRKPRLITRQLSEEELDALAEVTPEDIEAAKAWARQYGGELFAALLEAKEDNANL